MGGGGDNGYEARQQGIEDRKQQARDALNAMFGQAPTSPQGIASVIGPAPARSDFMKQGPNMVAAPDYGEWGGSGLVPVDLFDNVAYDAANADYNARAKQAQEEAAKTAQARDSLYQQVRDNAFSAGRRRLDEQQQDAARKLKFELFATGQAGGSGDVDQNARLNRTYSQGLIDLGAKADAEKADFRNADQDTRLQLLQSIDNGMDQGSALSQATQRMQIAADKAAADANGTALGNLFDTAGLLYDQSQYAKGRAAAQQSAFQLFPQRVGVPITSTAAGVTTRLPGE